MNTFEKTMFKTSIPLMIIAVLVFAFSITFMSAKSKSQAPSPPTMKTMAHTVDAGTDGDGIPDASPLPVQTGPSPSFVIYSAAVSGLLGALAAVIGSISRLIRALAAYQRKK